MQHERLGVPVPADGVLDPVGGGGRDLGKLSEPSAPFAGPAALARPLRRGLVDRGVCAQAGGDRHLSRQSAPRLGGVRGVADDIDPTAGQPLGEQIDHLPCHRGLARPLRVGLVDLGVLAAAWPPEPEQDRQAHGPLKERQPDADPNDHPVVAPRDRRLLAVGGRVVMVEAAIHLSPPALQERVVDRDRDRLPLREEPLHDQPGKRQPQLIGLPPRPAEEPVRARVLPHPRQTRADEHPAHRPPTRLAHLADQQRPERLKRRLRETRSQQGQQPVQRNGNMKEHRRRLSWAAATGLASDAASGYGQPTLRGHRRCSSQPPPRQPTPTGRPGPTQTPAAAQLTGSKVPKSRPLVAVLEVPLGLSDRRMATSTGSKPVT